MDNVFAPADGTCVAAARDVDVGAAEGVAYSPYTFGGARQLHLEVWPRA